MQEKRCLTCNQTYKKNPKYSKAQWNCSKFCSKKCTTTYKTIQGTEFKKCETCRKKFRVRHSELEKIVCCSKTCSDERRKITSIGSGNPSWKEETVGGLVSLHRWIKRRLPKPSYCQECKVKPPRDLANISQEYKQELSDWEWLCRRCHMVKDGRLEQINKRKYEINY